MFLLCVRVGTLATMQYIKILKKSYFMEFVSMNQDDNVWSVTLKVRIKSMENDVLCTVS